MRGMGGMDSRLRGNDIKTKPRIMKATKAQIHSHGALRRERYLNDLMGESFHSGGLKNIATPEASVLKPNKFIHAVFQPQTF